MKAALSNYLAAIGWLFATVGKIFSRQPGPFAAAAVALGILQVMKLLVTLLPLKVILLASSEGVPHYAPFIQLEHKTAWLGGLAAGTIVAYILVQSLGAFIKQISEVAGSRIMEEATSLNIVSNQKAQARLIFTELASIAADTIFWMVGFVVLILLAPHTAVVLAVCIGISLAIGTLIAIGESRPFLKGANRYLIEKTTTYLGTNKTIVFLIGFLSILMPFLLGWEVNMLGGLAAMMLLRRTIGAQFAFVRNAVRLVAKRHLVDALMFKNRQLVARPNRAQQNFAATFTAMRRKRLVADMITMSHPEKTVVSVDWVDPVVNGVSQFLARCDDGTKFQLQIYTKRSAHIAANENALFSLIDRDQVNAPKLISEIDYEDFRCRLLEAVDGELESPTEARRSMRATTAHIASVKPPRDLVEVYRSTHQLPHQRLSRDFVNRMRVAAGTEDEKKALRSFIRRLDGVKAAVEKLPLTIQNGDLKHWTLQPRGEGFPPLVTYWGRWSLLPLGGGVLRDLPVAALPETLETLRQARDDIPADLLPSELVIASQVEQLVSQIERGRYGAAMATVWAIENPTENWASDGTVSMSEVAEEPEMPVEDDDSDRSE